MSASDNIIVLPRNDVAAFMAAVAELEQMPSARAPNTDEREAIVTLSRIASEIDEQVNTQ